MLCTQTSGRSTEVGAGIAQVLTLGTAHLTASASFDANLSGPADESFGFTPSVLAAAYRITPEVPDAPSQPFGGAIGKFFRCVYHQKLRCAAR